MAPIDGITPAGLCSALVLIGAYDRQTGCPVLGIINEPFYRRDPLTHRYRHTGSTGVGGEAQPDPGPQIWGEPGDPLAAPTLSVPTPAGGRGDTTGALHMGTRS